MRILSNQQWSDGFLDYTCGPQSVRIRPLTWLNVSDIRSQYFVRQKSLRLVYNYIREVGLISTLRKIRSRSAESRRNEKFLSVGTGLVLEAGANAQGFSAGQVVGFIATNHPRCVERVVINARLVFALSKSESAAATHELAYLPVDHATESLVSELAPLQGWSEYSGNALPANMEAVFRAVETSLRAVAWPKARMLKAEDAVATEKPATRPSSGSRKTAVLYGYGNYAKSQCLPNVSKYIDVGAIHEIDPTQMPWPLPDGLRWSTDDRPDEQHDYDVYLIAGYHHTHAHLAEFALERNAFAVVEKPIVTTFEQLDSLGKALESTGGGLYSGFHKRYARYNKWIFEDLRAQPGEPISVHSVVFEVPLPDLHWYRWKNSCGRVVANGCHWIDHFLYMNDYSPVADMDVYVAPDETINASVVLQNGGLFTMVLTDVGSDRLGVQNNVEFRNANGTVRVINDGDYFAESHDRVLRKRNINRMDTYSRMYSTIARRIAEGDRGDSLHSFLTSAGLILELERRAREQLLQHASGSGRNAA